VLDLLAAGKTPSEIMSEDKLTTHLAEEKGDSVVSSPVLFRLATFRVVSADTTQLFMSLTEIDFGKGEVHSLTVPVQARQYYGSLLEVTQTLVVRHLLNSRRTYAA
jgi:hypothetical protein